MGKADASVGVRSARTSNGYLGVSTPSVVVKTPQPNRELARLVRLWRERIPPETMPAGLRRSSIVSQERIANESGYSLAWYRRLERGERWRYSDSMLNSVSTVLSLSPSEKTLLFLHAVGREPPERPPAAANDPHDELQEILEATSFPAFVLSDIWQVQAFNPPMRQWFPSIRRDINLMHWMFGSAEARKLLHRWREDWAPPAVSMMRLAQARTPDDARLTQVLGEVFKRNREVRDMWLEPLVELAHQSAQRSLDLPGRGQIPIKIVTMDTASTPTGHITVLIPVGPIDNPAAPSHS